MAVVVEVEAFVHHIVLPFRSEAHIVLPLSSHRPPPLPSERGTTCKIVTTLLDLNQIQR